MGLYDTTLGALLIGIFLNTFLYGLVTYQFAVYYRTKFNDKPATKYMVLFLFIVDTFHSASVIYIAWYYGVTNYDNPAALATSIWAYPVTAINIAICATMTQVYQGYRIWCLTKSRFLYGLVIVLAFPACILGIACGIVGLTNTNSELPCSTPVGLTWWAILVVLDVYLTVTLVIIFTRSRTEFRKMDTVLNRLIRGAVQSGLFATIFALADMITRVMFPNMNIYGTFGIPLARIYTNTFLDTLLTRESLKGEMEGTDQMNGGSGSLSWSPADPTRTTSMGPVTSIQLKASKTIQESCSSREGAGSDVVQLDV